MRFKLNHGCFLLLASSVVLLSCEQYEDELFEDELIDTRASVIGTFQAEARTFQNNCWEKSTNSGFTGAGYMDYGGNGAVVEWNNVKVPSTGSYNLRFRYANGSKGDRKCAVVINNNPSGNVGFAPTGAWTTWKNIAINVSLKAGNNTIRVTANTGAGGPNLDKMVVILKSVSGDDNGGAEDNGAAEDNGGGDDNGGAEDNGGGNDSGGGQLFKFEIRTDKYGSESSWKLSDKAGKVVASGPPAGSPYDSNKFYSKSLTLPKGLYKLEVFDSYGDGFCCPSGGEAYFKAYLDGVELLKGMGYTGGDPYFFKNRVAYDIRVGPSGHSKTEREKQYLDAHNKRRKRLHAEGGKPYVSLRWSHVLADHARDYAEELISKGICDRTLTVADHAKNTGEGENITKSSNLQYYSPDQILNRFVEYEEKPTATMRTHLYQVKWRATKYVGCADATGPNCQIHLCRYATTGNCGGSDKWIEDYTFCGPTCPKGGCFTQE